MVVDRSVFRPLLVMPTGSLFTEVDIGLSHVGTSSFSKLGQTFRCLAFLGACINTLAFTKGSTNREGKYILNLERLPSSRWEVHRLPALAHRHRGQDFDT